MVPWGAFYSMSNTHNLSISSRKSMGEQIPVCGNFSFIFSSGSRLTAWTCGLLNHPLSFYFRVWDCSKYSRSSCLSLMLSPFKGIKSKWPILECGMHKGLFSRFQWANCQAMALLQEKNEQGFQEWQHQLGSTVRFQDNVFPSDKCHFAENSLLLQEVSTSMTFHCKGRKKESWQISMELLIFNSQRSYFIIN